MTVRRRRWAWVPAVLFAAGLFALLFRRAGDAGRIVETLAGAFRRPGWLAAGVALFSVSLFSGLMRWFVLLRTLRLPVPFADALRLYATGHCFNVLGPGATGGDLVKGAWIAVRCPGRRAEAVASIAAERLIGLFAMSVLLCALTFVRADFFDAAPWLPPLRRMLRIAFCIGVVILATFAVFDLEALVRRFPTAKEGGLRARIGAVALRAWRTIRVCVTHPRAALAAFALSMVNFGADMLCWILLARSLGLSVPARDLAVVSPLANTVAATPVTPGGAGVRENALVSLLGAVGVPRADAAALGLLMFGVILFWALVCGAVMLLGARRDAATANSAADR